MNEKIFDHNPNPILSSSFLSKATFSWVKPMLALGRKKQLQITDLNSPIPEDEATRLTDALEKEWNYELELNKSNANLSRAIIRWYRNRYILNSIFIIFQEALKIIQPLFISTILNYFNNTMDLKEALIYAAVISLCVLTVGFLQHPYYFNTCCYGMRFRIAVSGLVYRKVLKLSLKTLDSKSAGDIINLLSTDATRIEFGVYYLPYFLIAPMQLIVVIVILYLKVGLAFLTGLLLLVAIMPAKSLIAKFFNKFRGKNCEKSDERISVLTEILNSIKIIKMYCWEIPFTKRVNHLRNQELKYQTILNLLQSATATIDTIMATLMTFFNISIFLTTANIPLIPSFIVFSIGFYMRLCNTIGFNFTRNLVAMVNFKVSADRIGDFLKLDELNSNKNESKLIDNSSNQAISISDFNFKWKEEGFTLKDINLSVNKGEFIAIVGPVGAGKSTLLLGLLNELENYTGKLHSNGKIFYLAQQPWVFTASIKQNITFGSEFNQEKFDKIVNVCSLKKDLELFAYAENTLVGEKGINLSGGQRARICLARALYSDSDIYLFDDTLSAVDGTVAKNIIKNCINDYLKDKTRILITHQIHHLESADRIYVLKNGEIEAQGTYKDLLNTHLAQLSSMASNENSESNKNEESLDSNENIPQETKEISQDLKAKEELIKKEREEAQKEGSVSFRSYITYFTSGTGYLGLFIVLFFFISGQAMTITADYWLSNWATNEEMFKISQENIYNCLKNLTSDFNCTEILNTHNDLNPDNISYIYDSRYKSYHLYIILTCIALIVVAMRSVLFFLFCVQNSKSIYEKLFNSVRDTSIRFYELNPLGRILNRFSKDTNNMDEMLTMFLYEFLQILMVILGALVVPITVNPWMILPLIPLGIVFYFAKRYFTPAGRDLKRLDNIYRSPLFVHANSSIEGITTIRSANKQELLVKEFETHFDNHTRACFGFFVAHRWFGLRLDFLCSLYTIMTLFACIFLKDNLGIKSGQIGLLMVYLFQLFDTFQWCIVMLTWIENLMTSIERIVEYTNIPTEPLHDGKEKPPVDWPSRGEIVFDNVSLSYDKNLPNVLKNISVKIEPGEKIGIVGRTGAGKSSFFQTIFRMYEPEGRILIDNVDIKNLSLNELREKLTIIPQEPVLFSGTVRYNLDPFDKYKDDDLWHSLESVSLKETIKSMNSGLDSIISLNGTNLSVGQKQLICLARAILKKTKILIIDEATANVDYKTDSIIQKTIREQFKLCTVLTIAHRLATVVDSDKILCLSEGKVVNFDRPKVLLDDENSVLFELTKKLSSNEKSHIYEIANGKRSLIEDLNELIKSQVEINQSTSKLNGHLNLAYDSDEKYSSMSISNRSIGVKSFYEFNF